MIRGGDVFIKAEILAQEIQTLKVELGLPSGRLPESMYVSEKRSRYRSVIRVSQPPVTVIGPVSDAVVVKEAPIKEARKVEEEPTQEKTRVVDDVVVEDVVIVQTGTDKTDEQLLLSSESEEVLSVDELLAGDVSGELVSLFLQDNEEEEEAEKEIESARFFSFLLFSVSFELCALWRASLPPSLDKNSSKVLAYAGNGWVVSLGTEVVDERYRAVEAAQPGWFETNLNEKREIVMFTGNAPVLGDFCACAVSDVRKGRREMSACIRSAVGEEVVQVDLDVVKAKQIKAAPRVSLPKLYSLALTPLLAERSKSEGFFLFFFCSFLTKKHTHLFMRSSCVASSASTHGKQSL
jgi:hypothetical protein